MEAIDNTEKDISTKSDFVVCQNDNGVEYTVFCYLLTDYSELSRRVDTKEYGLRKALREAGLSEKGGIYFYRFADDAKRFLKIGSTQREKGIDNRTQRGWSQSQSYTDSYVWSVRGETKESSAFHEHVLSITEHNPAYFVFYALPEEWSIPASDEFYAMSKHREQYGHPPINKEPDKRVWGTKIVFARNAFQEVYERRFPNNKPYPELPEKLR